VIAEISLHKIRNQRTRLDMMIETAAFAKEYLGQEHSTRAPITVERADLITGRTVRRARKAASRS
jgi:hypothetical protein